MAIAGLAVALALVNLGVLTLLMSVSHHDATLVTMLLVYSVGAGVAAALVLERKWGTAVEPWSRGQSRWPAETSRPALARSAQDRSWTLSLLRSTRLRRALDQSLSPANAPARPSERT